MLDQNNCFVHGDFKLDNLLLNDSIREILIIDWEKSGLGPCEVAIGNLFGAMVSNWISYKVSYFKGNFNETLSLGNWSPEAFFSLLKRMWTGFSKGHQTHSRTPVAEYCWQFAGLFLLHRAWVSNMLNGRLNLSAKMCADMGFQMVKDPQRFQRQMELIND